MFVFSTFTGLSYVDLQNLSWKDVITEDDGSKWISADRQKTKTEFNVKLLDIPVRIMEYYRGIVPGGKVFPYMNIGQVNVGAKADSEELRDKQDIDFPHEQILVCQSNLPVRGRSYRERKPDDGA